MNRYRTVSLPRDYGKWCTYVLIPLTPGSFVPLPVMALIRFFAVRRPIERKSPCVSHA